MTVQYGRALVQPTTLDKETREVDVVFATETPVTRFGWEEDFDEVLVCDPAAVRMERAERGLPAMDCHATNSVFKQVGRTTKVWINDARELCARVKFSQRAQVVELFQDIMDGIVKDISVGYNVFKYEREVRDNGQLPIYRAVDWMPTEISFAPVQADIKSEVRSGEPQHTVEIITSRNTPKPMKNKRTTEKGKTAKYTVADEPVHAGDIVTIDDVKGVALADGEVGDEITISIIDNDTPPAEGGEPATGGEGDGDDDAGAGKEGSRTAADKASRRRMADIKLATRAAKLSDEFAIELFESNKTIDQCRQAVIEKLAGAQPPAPHGGQGIEVGLDNDTKKRSAVENALLHRIYPAKFKLDSGAREFRGMSIVEIGKEMLGQRGISTKGMDKMAVADHFFKRSHSTSDFPLLFEGVIDKMLRAQYEFAPEFWDKIARQTTVADFREKGLYQAGAANGMKKVAESGEIKYTKLTESKATIRVESYAEGISFTRQAFINDDMGAFAIIPANFVRDWNALRGDLIWALLTDNVKVGDGKTLFCAEHSNLLTGATSALSEESLALAKVSLAKQKDIAGKLIRIAPKYLIVPPELEVTAKKLITSITPAKTSDVNVFAGQFDIIVEPRLTNAKEWYLAADPYAVDSLYYAYLEGNETLRVNSEDNFKTDTMDYAVRGDYGAAAIDHRGLVKSAGK